MMTEIYDVLIIGAGPAGLTAGYILTRDSGKSFLILEENPEYVGGISRTEKRGEFLFDIGGHRFFSKSQTITQLWREILPNDFIERPRTSRIFYDGKFYSYPLRAFEALRNLGIWESGLCVLSYLKAQFFPVKNPRSFHDWVANQFGERLFRIFFKTYTEKVWGMNCDDISADWAAQRIKGLNLATAILTSLKKSLGIKGGGSGCAIIKTLIDKFHYPRKGPGMLWDAAAQKIKAAGGEIIMGASAEKLHFNADKKLWSVTTADGRNFTARHVISSAALGDIIPHISPMPESAGAAQKLRYRDFITVAIELKHAPDFTDNWIYIHDPKVRVGRVQNFSSWSPEMVPAGKGCLGLEYFCFEGDGMWQMPDAELITLATAELEYLGLAGPDEITGGAVVRQKKAYPVYDDQYKEITANIREEFAAHYPGFHFVGRNGMHKYNNQDHAMMTAILTAQNIMADKNLHDVWQVNEDAQYHEEISAERLVPMPLKVNTDD